VKSREGAETVYVVRVVLPIDLVDATAGL